MPFNKKISGFENEFQFLKELNNTIIKDLNPLFRKLIFDLFNENDQNKIIIAKLDYNKTKTDLIINIDNKIKRISIKKGVKNSVHVEGISTFIDFLITNEIPKEIIMEYLKYHYADLTTNGTGEKRISVDEYKKSNQNSIDKINVYLNKEEIIKTAINRFIIQGRNSKCKIDAIIFGVIDDFIHLTKENVIKTILSKKDVYSTTVHFGCLTVQPLNRCLNYNQKYEHARHIVQIKWYNLADEIIESMNNEIINK